MPFVQKIDNLLQQANNTVAITPTLGNGLIAVGVGAGVSSALAISDDQGNTWHSLGNGYESGSGTYLAAWIAFNVAGTATNVTSTPGSGPANGFTVYEYSGLSASSPLTNFSWAILPSTPIGANGAVGTAITAPAAGLLFSYAYDFNGNAAPTAGTSPIVFTGRGTSTYAASGSIALGEDATVSSGSVSSTFGVVSANHFDNWVIFTVAINVVTDTIPCGTAASASSVATGTGGLALPAFAVGDCIVVLTMAQTASALTETFNGDGSNAYTHLQVADNHSTEGFILSRYATIVTTPLASPVLQSTFSGSATKLGIAAVKVGSISPGSPFVPGGNAQHLQTTPSGTNSQVSGLTTSANTNIPVTLVAWGLSVNFAGAPTAGSGFTPQGTAWSAFGAPCLTCETQTSSSLIQQQATFTPIGGTDTYTFLDVFNQLSVAFQILMGQACL